MVFLGHPIVFVCLFCYENISHHKREYFKSLTTQMVSQSLEGNLAHLALNLLCYAVIQKIDVLPARGPKLQLIGHTPRAACASHLRTVWSTH